MRSPALAFDVYQSCTPGQTQLVPSRPTTFSVGSNTAPLLNCVEAEC
jgi:hypothetical protein